MCDIYYFIQFIIQRLLLEVVLKRLFASNISSHFSNYYSSLFCFLLCRRKQIISLFLYSLKRPIIFFISVLLRSIILVGAVNYLLPQLFHFIPHLISLPAQALTGKNCFKGSQRGVSVIKTLVFLFLYLSV